MKRLLTISLAVLLFLAGSAAKAQQTGYAHGYSPVNGYIVPTDPQVLEKLDKWQDLKFGVLFHWGIYSVPGMMESWNLCSEDEEWEMAGRRRMGLSYEEFKQWYWGLSHHFNPTRFNPEVWADVMKEAGMKYMIITTKHHDGFCMFDTKYTDYKITNGPFGSNPRSNLIKEVLGAFREKDFMVGEYFSKPDWHCPWFWNPELATAVRGVNYDKAKHPDWWANYIQYTHNQLEELTTEYGPVDILWLDGGWINGDDIDLDKVLVGARKRNPGLISVDRACRNKNENYQTPEATIPGEQRNIPWETCDPLCSWGWQYNPNYKSARKVIGNLAEVIAKGGNYLLGIGPTPWGTIDDGAQAILREIGAWMDKYGEAVYNTRTTPLYNDGSVWFTAAKDGKTLYAIYELNDGEQLPATVEWSGNVPAGKVTLLSTGKTVPCKVKDGKVTLTLPKGLPQEAIAVKFEVK